MPYRRLPNTDAARLRALKMAYNKGKELPPFKLAFSQSTFQKVQSFLPSYEKNITESRFIYTNQIKKSKDYQFHLKKARMYISHFIQVMNMSIQRGELSTITRTFYGINENDKRIPSLNTEESVLIWGEKIIVGEAERVKRGLTSITNPTIALVKVRFENFKDAYHAQKTMKKSTARYVQEMSDLRKTADEIIAHVWNEVEDAFKNLPEDLRREKSIDYGLVYVYRKNELNKISLPFKVAMSALF
jgi:ribosomal protein L14E/L6E/L27E